MFLLTLDKKDGKEHWIVNKLQLLIKIQILAILKFIGGSADANEAQYIESCQSRPNFSYFLLSFLAN